MMVRMDNFQLGGKVKSTHTEIIDGQEVTVIDTIEVLEVSLPVDFNFPDIEKVLLGRIINVLKSPLEIIVKEDEE